jgi:hypothetical protein
MFYFSNKLVALGRKKNTHTPKQGKCGLEVVAVSVLGKQPNIHVKDKA